MHRLAALLVLLAMAPSALPCTTFCMARDGEVLFGRNYDFEIGQGYVMTNRRGLLKTSMAGTLHWSARFGSVTFNQWGREFPMDGMNEAGLVVALMWLDETVYPRDERPSLRVLEWIQYSLDNFGSVAELLARIEETRIAGGTPLHYLVMDATGDSATIEYLEGRLVVHRGAVALANDSYSRSSSYLTTLGSRVPTSSSSLDRFARASMLVRTLQPGVNAAFEILDDVAQRGATRWSVVYDAARRELWWVSDRNRSRKQLRFSDLALDCTAEAKMVDIHAPSAALEPYSADANRDLVVSSYAATSFTRNQPLRYAEEDAAHADAATCGAKRRRAVR
jgi:penicillin V acylase-like amidase (Ntn superfamily)